MTSVYELRRGTTPLILSFPHVGTELPADVAASLSPDGRKLEDTDWHVDRLYSFAAAAGASWLQARYSRYVIDLNRPPDDTSLYPGQSTTGLCPTSTFAGVALYTGDPPAPGEVARRRERYWLPYHQALRELIDSTRARFGHVVLLDAHSIKSRVPRFFPGRLADLNVGTNDGHSCEPRLAARVMGLLGGQQRFTHVLNGRFKGGHITRAYGDPAGRVHALQFELAQAAYMDETTSEYAAGRAEPLATLLSAVVAELLESGG